MKTINTSGKRKSAIARASISPGKGIIKINNQLLESIHSSFIISKIQEPLILAKEAVAKVNINVKVKGGGWNGQTDAVRVAIARGLTKFQSNLKKVFLEYDRGLLVSDIRHKEPRKPNDSKARASRQKSYR
jgi:small subunit ribosomal protein S9